LDPLNFRGFFLLSNNADKALRNKRDSYINFFGDAYRKISV